MCGERSARVIVGQFFLMNVMQDFILKTFFRATDRRQKNNVYFMQDSAVPHTANKYINELSF